MTKPIVFCITKKGMAISIEGLRNTTVNLRDIINESLAGASRNEGRPGDPLLLQARTRFLRGARKSIRIVNDELLPDIFDDPNLQEALKSAGERGVTIEIIAGPESDLGLLSRLAALPVRVFQSQSVPEKRDFAIVDTHNILVGVRMYTDQGEIEQYVVPDFEYYRVYNKEFEGLREGAR